MLHPRLKWDIEIETTTACPRRCSNCTRLVAHHKEPWFITPAEFRKNLEAVADFVNNPAPDAWAARMGVPARTRTVGMMGGEPLVHPDLPELCAIMQEVIPERKNRFLCSALDVDRHKYAPIIAETFGSVNRNTHSGVVMHQPGLVAIEELAPYAKEVREGKEEPEEWMWRHIDKCWLDEQWSSTINPKGFFWCEVAGAMSLAMGGPEGLPVEPGCWDRPLEDYLYQAEWACPKCSICVPLPARQDTENRDDISIGNVRRLEAADSPRIARGEFVVFDPESYCEDEHTGQWKPQRYMR